MAQVTQFISMEAGTHYICACGRSKNSPYCDGSHKGTSVQPIALELETPKLVEISGAVSTTP